MIIVSEKVIRQKRMVRRIRMWWRALDGQIEKRNVWMVTLTYRHTENWNPRDITRFLQRLRNTMDCKAYAWIAAVQPGTGRVHYHIMMVGPRPLWVMQRWGKGRTEVKAAWSAGYLLKYLWSQDINGLPKGCRRFATWIKKGLLSSKANYVYRLSYLPDWVARYLEEIGGWVHKESAGIWITDIGIILTSDWRAFV